MGDEFRADDKASAAPDEASQPSAGELLARIGQLQEQIERLKSEANASAEMMREAEDANIKKSRFLKIAIHDLRQPIQTLSLLHDALTYSSAGAGGAKLAERLGAVLTAASNGVNRLSEIAELDAGRMDACHYWTPPAEDEAREGSSAGRSILLVEDDPAVAAALEMILAAEGYQVSAAADGWQALELAEHGTKWPDLVIASYDLPDGLNGLDVIVGLKDRLDHDVAAIVLTAGVTEGVDRAIENRGCASLGKPVKGAELVALVQRALSEGHANGTPMSLAGNGHGSPTVFVVDDDPAILEAMRDLLEANGCAVEGFTSGAAFFAACRPEREGCVLVDAFMPGMDGFELIERLKAGGYTLPAIMVTGAGDVPMAVRAMKAGAVNFIEKPVSARELLDCLHNASGPCGGRGHGSGAAAGGGGAVRVSDGPSAPDHRPHPGRRTEQKHRQHPRPQPAHRRKPSRGHHEKNGRPLFRGAGPLGDCRQLTPAGCHLSCISANNPAGVEASSAANSVNSQVYQGGRTFD